MIFKPGRYPLWLVSLEQWLWAERDTLLVGRVAAHAAFWLANRRLNVMLCGLFQAIYWQTEVGTMRVFRDARGPHVDWQATAKHAQSALAAISLFIANEAAQRGIELTESDADA